jgi:hypothetical protein
MRDVYRIRINALMKALGHFEYDCALPGRIKARYNFILRESSKKI